MRGFERSDKIVFNGLFAFALVVSEWSERILHSFAVEASPSVRGIVGVKAQRHLDWLEKLGNNTCF